MAVGDKIRPTDRIGLGWRAQLAAGILLHLDEIDVVEVIADDYFNAPSRSLRALTTLAAQVPVVLHGVTLGPASTVPVDGDRLEQTARLLDHVRPQFWSEHLAFVRGGRHEIGHLAAPPRTDATIEGTAKNMARAGAIVGAKPLLENVATLIEPPGSRFDEPTWLAHALSASDCDLLLDLHNLYANALNFGCDPFAMLTRMPVDRVAAVHLAGGKWISTKDSHQTQTQRLLDDHLHDVPEVIFDLLTEVGQRTRRPLTVILERDGQYPPIEHLLAQVRRARHALARGRARLSPATILGERARKDGHEVRRTSSTPAFEAFLARIYVDDEARASFLADPTGETHKAGLPPEECAALGNIDRTGLQLASRSFARKRRERHCTGTGSHRSRWLSWLRGRSA